MPARTLLVGCGKLGLRLGREILDEGGEVMALRRSEGALPAGFTAIAADLRRPLEGALPACDAMVITLPPDSTESGQPSFYHAALTHLVAALPVRPHRVVFVSSTRVFEGRPGAQPLTEADAPAPISTRGAALREGELLAARLFDAVIVRPAGIYGPGRDSLIRRVLQGVAVDHSQRTNRIHESDLVRLLDAMLRAPEPPRLVHAVDRAPALLGDVVSHIAARLGVDPPPRLAEAGGGTVLDGSLLAGFLGELRYPTYQSGYDELIALRPLTNDPR